MATLTAKQEKEFEQWVSPEGPSFSLHQGSVYDRDCSDADSMIDGEGSEGLVYNDDEDYSDCWDY